MSRNLPNRHSENIRETAFYVCFKVMLSIGTGRIFLATAPVDMRRGHDRLVAFVCSELDADPYQNRAIWRRAA